MALAAAVRSAAEPGGSPPPPLAPLALLLPVASTGGRVELEEYSALAAA